jgi:hypothetical protein
VNACSHEVNVHGMFHGSVDMSYQIIGQGVKLKFDVVEYLVLDVVNQIIRNAREIIVWK